MSAALKSHFTRLPRQPPLIFQQPSFPREPSHRRYLVPEDRMQTLEELTEQIVARKQSQQKPRMSSRKQSAAVGNPKHLFLNEAPSDYQPQIGTQTINPTSRRLSKADPSVFANTIKYETIVNPNAGHRFSQPANADLFDELPHQQQLQPQPSQEPPRWAKSSKSLKESRTMGRKRKSVQFFTQQSLNFKPSEKLKETYEKAGALATDSSTANNQFFQTLEKSNSSKQKPAFIRSPRVSMAINDSRRIKRPTTASRDNSITQKLDRQQNVSDYINFLGKNLDRVVELIRVGKSRNSTSCQLTQGSVESLHDPTSSANTQFNQGKQTRLMTAQRAHRRRQNRYKETLEPKEGPKKIQISAVNLHNHPVLSFREVGPPREQLVAAHRHAQSKEASENDYDIFDNFNSKESLKARAGPFSFGQSVFRSQKNSPRKKIGVPELNTMQTPAHKGDSTEKFMNIQSTREEKCLDCAKCVNPEAHAKLVQYRYPANIKSNYMRSFKEKRAFELQLKAVLNQQAEQFGKRFGNPPEQAEDKPLFTKEPPFDYDRMREQIRNHDHTLRRSHQVLACDKKTTSMVAFKTHRDCEKAAREQRANIKKNKLRHQGTIEDDMRQQKCFLDNTSYRVQFLDAGLTIKPPSQKPVHQSPPNRKLGNLTNYKQAFASNHHQTMVTGKNLLNSTTEQRHRTKQLGSKQKAGTFMKIDHKRGKSRKGEVETSYKTAHSLKAVKQIAGGKPPNARPIDTLYCPKELKLLEKQSASQKEFTNKLRFKRPKVHVGKPQVIQA